MDTLFFIAGIICGIETIMLFMGKDCVIFWGGKQKEEDYHTEELYRAERWPFMVDTILFVIIGAAGDRGNISMVCVGIAFLTLFLHAYNFKKYKKSKKSGIVEKSKMNGK